MKSAIYKITFTGSNRIYIGSTVNYIRRKSQHLYKLKNKTHENKKLQNYYNKYGKSNFNFEVLEYIYTENKLEIRKIEQSYLNKYFAQEYINSNRKDNRFDLLTLNVSPEVGLEIHHWDEKRRLKQINSNKNRIWTEESRDKMSKSKLGTICSEDHKSKTSISMKKARFGSKITEDRKCIYCNSNDVNKCGIRFNKTLNIKVQRFYCNICKTRFQK